MQYLKTREKFVKFFCNSYFSNYFALALAVIGSESQMYIKDCGDGWYWEGLNCAKCLPECKTCTNNSECQSCEKYMIFNDTMKACSFCSSDQYYDPTYQICRNCDNKCTGDCKGRLQCFTCDTVVCKIKCPPLHKKMYPLHKKCLRCKKMFLN